LPLHDEEKVHRGGPTVDTWDRFDWGELSQMRTMCAAVLALCILARLQQPALGEEACATGQDKLGVARTATIDTSSALRFGMQYKSSPLLADGEVVLTFDDGPTRAYTRPILEALEAQCTKATFFMVGRMAVSDPGMVKEVARLGHTVATHTWSHANLAALSHGKAQDEIEMGFSAVQHALGKPIAPFFRFPYLSDSAITLSHLKGRRLAAFSIDIDSKDFQIRDAGLLYERVMREVAAKRKGIILFHDIHASTARALPRILAALYARGFRVVHLVPKANAETVAEYDVLARQAAEHRRMTAASNPLSKRAITWPSTVLSDAKGPAKGLPAPRPPLASEDESWTVNVWSQSH
jgi:peptidoglycan/xylan/chitin deacetylase (PgdA/CDA1 family)